MTEKLRLLLLILFAFLVSTPTFAQVTLQVGGGVGVFAPQADYGGTTIDFYRGTKYGLSSGVNVHGKVRLGLVGLMLVGEADYSSLNNSGNSEPGQGRVEVSQKVVSLKAGPELQLKIPAAPLTPYIGANISINRFSGETMFQGVSKVPSATYVLQSSSRLGVGVSGGAIVKLGPSLDLDIGLQYNLMNVSGRSWEDLNPQDQRLDSYLALNDDRDPAFLPNDDKHFIFSQRSIHSILFTISLLFGL